MRYALLLFWLRLKAGARSSFFLLNLVLLCCLAALFGWLMPERPSLSLSVGLLAQSGAVPDTVTQKLLKNEDYQFIQFYEEAELQRSVINGELHCAYRITDDERQPVTLWRTQGSYLVPAVNEVVLAAYLEATTPELTKRVLLGLGVPPPEDMNAYLTRLRETMPLMTIELSGSGGSGWVEQLGQSGVQMVFYAVLGAAFTAMVLLSALLRGREQPLLTPRGRRVEAAICPLAADAVLGLLALLAADAVASAFYAAPPYPLSARFAGFAVLALLATVLSTLLLPLSRHPAFCLLALPLLAVAWVALSGAVVEPRLLPGGLGMLRFLSPPWYCLRVMAVLGHGG